MRISDWSSDVCSSDLRIRIPMSFDLDWQKPTPLVEREWRLGICERLDEQGNVLIPLDHDSLQSAVEKLRQDGIEAVAVCFLHSYRNGAHEKAVGDYLAAQLPDLYVSLSHDVLPEILEFERTSTRSEEHTSELKSLMRSSN